MKVPPICLPVLLLTILAFSWTGRGAAMEGGAVLEDIKRSALATRTLSGGFVQVKRLSILDERMVSRGTFALRKPDMIRWEYLEPFHSLFVINKDDLYRWNGITGRVERMKISSDPALRLFSEHLLSWAKFDMEYFERHFEVLVQDGEPVVVVLKPRKEGNTMVEKIVVEFEGREHIRSLAIFEPGGDFTNIEFTGVRLNLELPGGIFTSP